jgi:hypothetical protein
MRDKIWGHGLYIEVRGPLVEDIYHRIYGKLNRIGVFEIRRYANIEKAAFCTALHRPDR